MAESTGSIKKLIDEGKHDEANQEVEALLELGPNNVEAHKLKATIFSQRGYFNAEHYTWCKIMELAPEDPDVIDYFNYYYLEKKERFYFTDRMPEGGRRFFSLSKMLIEAIGTAFFGCIAFLVIYHEFNQSLLAHIPYSAYALLGVLVVIPWLFIIRAALIMPGDLRVTCDGFWMTNRFHLEVYCLAKN